MTKDLDVFCSILGRESKKKTCWSLKLLQEHTNMRRRKKRPLFLTLERSREEKKRHPETCRTSRMSPPSPNTIEPFLGFPALFFITPLQKLPLPPRRLSSSRALKPGLSAAPWWPAKAYSKRQARLVIKSLEAVKHRADRFGCVACANGTAEILICFVCKKVKCVQYTTKITATLHLL